MPTFYTKDLFSKFQITILGGTLCDLHLYLFLSSLHQRFIVIFKNHCPHNAIINLRKVLLRSDLTVWTLDVKLSNGLFIWWKICNSIACLCRQSSSMQNISEDLPQHSFDAGRRNSMQLTPTQSTCDRQAPCLQQDGT